MHIRQSKRPIMSKLLAKKFMDWWVLGNAAPGVTGVNIKLLKTIPPGMGSGTLLADFADHIADFSGHAAKTPNWDHQNAIGADYDGAIAMAQWNVAVADPLITNTIVGYLVADADEMYQCEAFAASEVVPLIHPDDSLILVVGLGIAMRPIVG